MLRIRSGFGFVSIAAAALLAACSASPLESDLGLSGAPDWVNKGTAYVNDKDGRLFHGVGAAAPMGDATLQRSVADDRARAEVARIFSSYLDVVARDFQAASRSGDANMAQEAVSRNIKSLTQVNLAGTRIVARWFDKRTNTVYSIAEIDMRQVKDTAATAREMNDDARRYVQTNAENVFDRVSQDRNSPDKNDRKDNGEKKQ